RSGSAMSALTSSTRAPVAITASAVEAALTPLAEGSTGVAAPWEVVRMAVESLVANKTRSLLTMLGVIIGVASVVALLSVGQGASAAITGQVSALGTNMLTIVPGVPNNQSPGAGAAATLTQSDSDAIAALNLPLAGLAPQFGGSAQIIAAAADKNASIIGTTPAYAEM